MVLETFTVVAEPKEIQYIVYLRWYKIYLREDGECEALGAFRIRGMRNVRFDREWHELKVVDNFDVTAEK